MHVAAGPEKMAKVDGTRSLQIDTLRGLTCLLLVLFHVAGDRPTSGLMLPTHHWLRIFNDIIAYVRMPLFAFMSGYMYAHRPCTTISGRFLHNKAQRMLLPVLTVGTIFAFLQASIPGASSMAASWWTLHINPVGHFWFLQSLFIIFLVVVLLEHARMLTSASSFAIAWGLSALLFVTWEAPPHLGLSGSVYLLPFFLGGLACKRFAMEGRQTIALALFVFVAASVVSIIRPEDPAASGSPIAEMLVGLSGALLLLRSGMKSALLARIGTWSFVIYLLHIFFTAGCRIVLRKFGMTDTGVLLAAGLTAGMTGPVLAALVIRRQPWLDFLLLGGDLRKTQKISGASGTVPINLPGTIKT